MEGSWMLLAVMQSCDVVPGWARKRAVRSEVVLIQLLGNEQGLPRQEVGERRRTMAGRREGGLGKGAGFTRLSSRWAIPSLGFSRLRHHFKAASKEQERSSGAQ